MCRLSLCLCLLLTAPASAALAATPLGAGAALPIAAAAETRALSKLAPDADPQVLALAIAAMHCAQLHGSGTRASRLAVIDYSRPSLQKRLWVFDLDSRLLLRHEWVAHGKGSGEDLATRFSNEDGSLASSLGMFLTGDTYIGENGYSLRMAGLEAGFNDAAASRAIVVHGADYVDPEVGKRQGRLGRSWGCPALRTDVARDVIDELKQGQFLFSYYPDQAWLTRSALLHCEMAEQEADVRPSR